MWCEEDDGRSENPLAGVKFSRTHLYLSLLDILIKNAANKQSEQQNLQLDVVASFLSDREESPPNHANMPCILTKFHHIYHFTDMLLPFCELAFNDLISDGTKLVFHKGQLERQLGKSHVDLAHRLGLISQAKVRGKVCDPQNVSVSFYHKSVQELLAAMYLTCETSDAVTLFCGYCSTVEKVMGDSKRYNVCGRFAPCIRL